MNDHRQLTERLEALVDRDNQPDWKDVVRRADRAPESQPRPARAKRSRRSYLSRRLLPALAVAAALFGLLLASPWERGPRSTIIDRALAAIETGPVLHVVLETGRRRVYVDLPSGRETPQVSRVEVWYDRQQKRAHTVLSTDGHIEGDFLDNDPARKPAGWAATLPYNPGVDPAVAGFIDSYRAALENGDARVVGDGTIDGHAVTWIELTRALEGRRAERIAIDKASSLPIEIDSVDANGEAHLLYHVALVETLPEGEGNFAPHEVAPFVPVGLSNLENAAQVSPADAANAFPSALWAGDTVGGLALSSVSSGTFTYQQQGAAVAAGPGLKLRYGTGSAEGVRGEFPSSSSRPKGTYVWIEETTLPMSVYWSIELYTLKLDPPPGSVLIYPGAAIRAGDHMNEPSYWGGFLYRNGVRVTITTSSRDLLLTAARALEPIR